MSTNEISLTQQTLRELTYSQARILVIDDDEAMVMFLQGLLERVGYSHLLSTTDPRQAVPAFESLAPDLVILDLHMPYLDGFAVLDLLRDRIRDTEYLPILVLTGTNSPQAKWRALFRGARDFLNKPFDPLELLLRLHNLLEARFLHLKLEERNQQLAGVISERTQQLVWAQDDTIECLAQVVEFHDDATGQHTRRVGETAARIAMEMGLPPDEVEMIRRAAPLHDVGKIAIPDSILLKPDRLTPDEYEVMKMHTSIGARILSGGRSDYLAFAEMIALAHHERWDGAGYPQGLRAEEIPLPARIVAVADFYDALTHDRPYRTALSTESALAEVSRETGRQLDPHVVQALIRTLQPGA